MSEVSEYSNISNDDLLKKFEDLTGVVKEYNNSLVIFQEHIKNADKYPSYVVAIAKQMIRVTEQRILKNEKAISEINTELSRRGLAPQLDKECESTKEEKKSMNKACKMTEEEEKQSVMNLVILLTFGQMVLVIIGVLFICGSFLEEYLFWRLLTGLVILGVAVWMRYVTENRDGIKKFLRRCFKYSIESREV